MRKGSSLFNKLNSFLLWGFVTLPQAGQAATLESVINNGVRYLQGPLARAVGVGIIAVAGYSCFRLHKLPKEQFMYIAVGLGVIFGAQQLYSMLGG